MTDDGTLARYSPSSAEMGVLERLLAPVGCEQFVRRHWGREPLLVRGADDPTDRHGIPALFSAEAVDELLTRRGLRAPFIRMAKQGRTLADTEFTSGGGVGANVADQVSDDRVRRQFAAGATIVLQGLHRAWGPVIDFAQALAAELGHPAQVNAYVTPPGNQGFSAHYDIHDVFVLQVAGSKAWRVHAPVWPAPLRSQPWDQRAAAVAEAAAESPLLATDCRPGDVLYLPRGYIHSAVAPAMDEVSIHLTVGVHVWTRAHLVDAALEHIRAELATQPELRASLPLGVDVSDPRALTADTGAVREAIAHAAGEVSDAMVAGTLLASSRAAQRPAPLPVLSQTADARRLSAKDSLDLRPHLSAILERGADSSMQLVVRSRAGRALLSARSEAALRRLLGDQRIAVTDLVPGDESAALAAARTLLVEGVAILVTSRPAEPTVPRAPGRASGAGRADGKEVPR